MKIAIINGPNLNLLGKREPSIYGDQSFEKHLIMLKEKFCSVSFYFFQSNHEGDIVDQLQRIGFAYDGIVLNAGAYTHTSIAIADAVKSITTPVVEVHISNVYAREAFRHTSFIAPNVKGVIVGFGLKSYDLAIQSFL